MKEQLFSVGIQHKKTGERISLQVWAENVDKATAHLVHGSLIGPDAEYRWTGSGPIYENNEIVTSEVPT